MKIRQGFISNSSSTSFVLITTREAIDEEFGKIKDANLKKIIRSELRPPKQVSLFGEKVLIYLDRISSEDFGCDCDIEDDSGEYHSRFFEFLERVGGRKDGFYNSEEH